MPGKIVEPTGMWRLVCPANDPKSARTFEGALPFRAALQVAIGTGSVYTWDEKAAKLFVRVGAPEPAPVLGGVTYPSGSVALRHPENNDADYQPAHHEEASPLVKTAPDIQVSKHFRLSEFRPKSNAYDGVRVHPGLVELLEKIRAAAGCPIRITSAYRPPAYNRAQGGVESSNHQDGTAADIYADKLNTSQLHEICSKILGNTGGLGYYPGMQFCHVDIGPYARWQG